jgi:hypothetical protein
MDSELSKSKPARAWAQGVASELQMCIDEFRVSGGVGACGAAKAQGTPGSAILRRRRLLSISRVVRLLALVQRV